MASLLIKNAKVVLGDQPVPANIYVEGGKIAAISLKEYEADQVVDAEGQLAVPGGIDIHAHVYDPAKVENEDWRSGSLAAAFGGLTTIIDMPLRTYVDTVEVLRKKLEQAAKDSFVNYGVTAGFIDSRNLSSIPALAKEGVRTFKIFTARPFRADDYAIVEALERVAEANAVAIFHAEDDALIELGERRYRQSGDPLHYHMHRSGLAEAAAVYRVALYGAEVGARVHIAHLSSKEGVEAVRAARRYAVALTAETCPHFLYFTRDDVVRLGNYIKVAPTLKTREDRDALWQALEEGVVDAYASDNAPAPRQEKEKGTWEAWGGVPNLEVMLPLLFTLGVMRKRLSLKRFVDVTSRNPAKILRLYPAKGELAVGSDADIAVLETRTPRKISASTHHHKVDWTPWEGLELYGHPLHLVVGGKLVIAKGEVVGKPGTGEYVFARKK